MITASVVVYKTGRDELSTVLKCLINSSIAKVYIIDNSPTDELRDFAEISVKVEYIYGQVNVGYGAAHNIAIHKAIEYGTQYHIVINPDIYFDNEVIEQLKSYMDAHSHVGQIMPKVVYPNGDIQYLCKLIPTPLNLFGRRFLPSKLIKRQNEKYELRFADYNKIMNIPYLSGCFMFFRISALKKIGLFDEIFFMYPEDIDITRRMHREYETIFLPEVTIIHAHAADSYKNTRMLWIHLLNMIKYFNKWGWIFDKERKIINNRLLKELGYKKKN